MRRAPRPSPGIGIWQKGSSETCLACCSLLADSAMLAAVDTRLLIEIAEDMAVEGRVLGPALVSRGVIVDGGPLYIDDVSEAG